MKRIDSWLILLFTAFLARVWLMVLPSSLWVDEIVTFFVVRHPGDASFAVAPQVQESIYYWLPKMSMELLGNSEAALRLPSLLAMGAALFFIARLAVRLVHPCAAWFAVFACLAFRSFDYFALDARPYGAGIAVASASLLFLIRWFDKARWRDEAVFVLLAALLWRVHLFYWPFYLVYGVYAAVRLARRDTPVNARQIVIAVAAMAAALAPVALTALKISREAGAHAFNPQPSFRNLFYLLHAQVILLCLGVGWCLRRFLRWPSSAQFRSGYAAFALIFCWWLVCPLSLFAYSHITGNGVFIVRYVSLMIPGMALAAAAVTGRFLPAQYWKPAALATGVVALVFLGQWRTLWPPHEADDWRDAAALERSLAADGTPVICPSPFVEAQPPVWSPDYRLPGFLYSHLTYYPLRGRLELFPFQPSPESAAYSESVLAKELLPSGEFILYGSTWALRALDGWFGHRPELAAWHKVSRRFDAISVIVYRDDSRASLIDKALSRDIP